MDKGWTKFGFVCLENINPAAVQSLSLSKVCPSPNFVHTLSTLRCGTGSFLGLDKGWTKFGFVCICTKIQLVSRVCPVQSLSKVCPCPKFVQSLSNLKSCAGHLVGQSLDKPWTWMSNLCPRFAIWTGIGQELDNTWTTCGQVVYLDRNWTGVGQ